MRQQIKKAMDLKDFTYKELSSRTGHSEGVLNKFISKGESVKFEIVLDIIRLLLPDDEEVLMFSYCQNANTPKQIKAAIEYSSTHWNWDVVKELIGKCERSNNKEINEWGYFYNVFYQWKQEDINSDEMYEIIRNKKTIYPELKAFKRFLEMYNFYTIDDFVFVDKLSIYFTEEMDSLDDGYIKDSYYARYHQVMAHVSLYVKCLPEQARQISLKGIQCNIGSSFNAFFYNIIAASYFNVSDLKMNHYALKSLDIYSEICTIEQIDDMKVRFEKFNIIMNKEYNKEFTKNDDDPIDLFIEGVRNSDINKLIQCLVNFIKYGDKFLSCLPARQLALLGYDKNIIDSIQSIK